MGVFRSAALMLNGCAVLFISAGGVRIGYIGSAISGRYSTDAAPVTGSLVFFATFDCLHGYCAAECACSWLFCGTDCDCLARCDLFIGRVGLCWIRTIEGAALVEDRAGITFGVDAPEAVVDIHSEGVSLWGMFRTLLVCSAVGRMRRKVEFCKGGMSAYTCSGSRFAGTGSDLPRHDNCGHG